MLLTILQIYVIAAMIIMWAVTRAEAISTFFKKLPAIHFAKVGLFWPVTVPVVIVLILFRNESFY